MATLAEILASLSTALDLVEGQPEGHATRTCLIALRVADALSLPEQDKCDLYFASLIKDAGCSNNSARIHAMFGGDEIISKREVKFIDWAAPVESIKFALQHTERGNGVRAKLQRMLSNIGNPRKVMDEVTEARCTRGAEIARNLGFSDATVRAVRDLDEHWDGHGSPRHLSGDEISVIARILCFAQTLEVFVSAFGVAAAFQMARARSGKWFDPKIVDAGESFEHDHLFWLTHAAYGHNAALSLPIPASAQVATEADIDSICEAFAQVIDAKSAFTGEHSSRVTRYAVELADIYGFAPDRRRTLRRAALLHDIGKLGVTNAILDKPGKLSEDEFETIKGHPYQTLRILQPISGFHRIAEVAAAHHERLDGTGYWRGLTADQLDLDMRILAVADVFDALSAERPYRRALDMDEVFAIMDREACTGLDADCVASLKERYLESVPLAA